MLNSGKCRQSRFCVVCSYSFGSLSYLIARSLTHAREATLPTSLWREQSMTRAERWASIDAILYPTLLMDNKTAHRYITERARYLSHLVQGRAP